MSGAVNSQRSALKTARRHDQSAMLDSFGKIDSQDLNGRATDGRQTDQHWSVPCKMLRPSVFSRIEQRVQCVAVGIVARDVGPFVAVARQAGPCQIHRCREPRMLFRSDVIQLEGLHIELIPHLAVFATTASSVPDQATT